MTDPFTNSVWEYVLPSEFKLPPAAITEAFKGGLAGLWQRLKPTKVEARNPVKAESDLQLLSNEWLDAIAPHPIWQNAVIALEDALVRPGELQNAAAKYTVVVGLPHGGNEQILDQLAQAQNWSAVSPPAADQILSQDDTWLDPARNRDVPWVLPALERCFLRHPRGLGLVRRMFQQLQSGDLGSGVVGIDSWAWVYLSHVAGVRLPRSLMAQAFDHERLSRWLQKLAAGWNENPIFFRQSDSAAWIWGPPADLVDACDMSTGSSP